LESVIGGERWARYTFLGTEPSEAYRLRGDRVDRWTRETGWGEGEPSRDPLRELGGRLLRQAPAHVPGLPRFWGGAVGYFGYDVIRHIERLPHPPPDTLGLPDAMVILTRVVLAIDNLLGKAQAIVGVDVEGADRAELRRRYDEAAAEID